MAIRALSVVLLSLAGALSSRDEGAQASRLEVEFAGCARVRPGPVCELGEQRELTLWVPGSEKPQIGGAESVREARFVEAGWRMKLGVPAGAREVRVRAGERRGTLRVADSSEPQPLRELARLWKDGQWEQVRAALDAVATELHGAERERIRAYRARLAMRDGDNARAARELEQTAESAHRAGLLLEASHDRFAAAYIRTNRLAEYERAREDLAATGAEFVQVPEVRARLAYHRGVLARTTGDVQAALTHFRDASVLARRIDLIADELTARQELSLALNRLHRHTEALAEQEAIVALEVVKVPSCVDSLRWENLAWIALSQPEPKFQRRAAEALDRAERIHAQCPDPISRRNLELNRVELALLRGDTEDAANRLKALEADTTGRSTRLAAWEALYSGRLAALRGDGSKALAAFEQSVALAESVQLLDCVYAAKLGRARALSSNQDPAVVDAYLQAERAVDALLHGAPFGQGQQLTALRTRESSQELLSVLLERNDVTQAYALAARAARRAWAASFRANRIAALSGARKERWDRAIAEYQRQRQALERAARDDWKMSTEGLSQMRLSRALEVQRLENALAEGYALLADEPDRELPRATQGAELTLARGKDDWFAFLRRDNVLKVERLRDVRRDLVTALERFEHQKLLDAPMLRVIAPPELATLDVQALELGGHALIERMPVAYGFEPGRASEPPAPRGRIWTALVLGDPNEDLPWARAEARRLSSRLPHSLSWFGAEVGFESVRSHLPDVGLLHFAGHANSGGLDGLDGALQLGAGQRLTFGDIFSLRRVPEFVVLSACTSSVSPGSGGGLSIGQAFVAAGSRVVIGASRAVSDRLAQNFMQALYDALLSESGAELPRDDGAWARAVRVASMKVKRDDPSADWASLRLLVP